jgi:hypothetical protein
MSSPPPRGALALAEEAFDHVQTDPAQAASLAERALALARLERNSEAQVASLHALSWAQHLIGDPSARRTARTGIRVGLRSGERRRVALLRRRLALTLAFDGAILAARREIDAAVADLSGVDRAQSEVFRVAIHRSAHAVDPATHRRIMSAAASALRRFERDGDQIWQARLLFNRGSLHADRGELLAAEDDFRRAHELYEAAGADAAVADAAVGLAAVALLRGDVVGCLRGIESAKAALPSGIISFGLDQWQVAALTQARLLPEAAAAVARYVDACFRSGRSEYVAAARLEAARIAMLSGDPLAAQDAARWAVRSFAARGKSVNAALARAICLRAQLLSGEPTVGGVRTALDAAEILQIAGWRIDALRARLLAAHVACAAGARWVARRELERARPLQVRGTVADRIEWCHVSALLRLSDHDTVGAERFLKRGLRHLEEYRAALGAVELRVTASAIGSELSKAGLRIAVESRDPTRILAWAEHLRANGLRLPLVRPPSDPELRARQGDLRVVAARIREAEETGQPVRGLAVRQIELEAAIRKRTRLARSQSDAIAPIASVREAREALGKRVLIEYVELGGTSHAVTLADGRLDLWDLGEIDVKEELDWLRFALGRLARGDITVAQRSALLASARAAATSLDSLIVTPLLPALDDAPLVVVPTGPLSAVPWGALPSLHGRPVAVVPSLSLWLELAKSQRSRRRKHVLVAGPGLRHGTTEVNDLAAMLPSATVIQGKAATTDAVLSALDGAALAHFACHGRFRSDSPLFSSLELVDGPLSVLDLQRLRSAPEAFVLSACDLALSERHPGDELLGFAAALLAMRTRTIIASVVPVPDAASRRLMLNLHQELARGTPPAAALAHAQERLRPTSAALAGFVCLGAG